MFNSTIFKTYGKRTINVSTNNAYIIHFSNYSLSDFLKIILLLFQIQWNAKRIFNWFIFATFKSPLSIPLNNLLYFHDINLIMVGLIVNPFFLIKGYLWDAAYLFPFPRKANRFHWNIQGFWKEYLFWFSFLSYFKSCIQRQYRLLYCSLSHILYLDFNFFSLEQ